MEIKGNETNYVFTMRVEFTADGSDEFIEFREPTMGERNELVKLAQKVKNANGEIDTAKSYEVLDKLEKNFDSSVVNSSFTYGGDKATGAQIHALLKKRGALFESILATWLTAALGDEHGFSIKKKSDESFS